MVTSSLWLMANDSFPTVTLGYKSVLKTLRSGKAKLVIIAGNTAPLRKSELECTLHMYYRKCGVPADDANRLLYAIEDQCAPLCWQQCEYTSFTLRPRSTRPLSYCETFWHSQTALFESKRYLFVTILKYATDRARYGLRKTLQVLNDGCFGRWGFGYSVGS